MNPQLLKFQTDKVLPAAILDFVLRDRVNGIVSNEFETALTKGDAKNIIEGIDSIILNAETKTRIRLSESDRLRVHMIAQDEIVQKLLTVAERRIASYGG